MSVALSVHVQVLAWCSPAVLAPVVVAGGVRRLRSRREKAAKRKVERDRDLTGTGTGA